MSAARRPIQSSIRLGNDEAADPGSELKEAMSHWATGVAVLAVRYRDNVQSITVNSFISVSLDPPTILVSLSEQAAILHALNATGRFTISILDEHQTRVATMVADRIPTTQQLFEGDEDPVLKDGIVTLVCTTSQTQQAGDHFLYLAVVERVVPGKDAPPLLYYRRSYHRPPH
jgi:flavin reductase (NADH)